MDKASYRKEVIGKLRGARQPELLGAVADMNAGKALPDSFDLPWLYGITPGLVDAAIARQIEEVLEIWRAAHNSATNQNYQVANLCLALHKSLEAQHAGLRKAAFWQARFAERDGRAQQVLATLVTLLKAQFAIVKVVPEDALLDLARTDSGLVGLGLADLIPAAKAADLTVVRPFPDLTVKPAAAISNGFGASGCRTLAHAFFPDAEEFTFTIVDGYRCTGTGALDRRALEAAKVAVGKKPSDKVVGLKNIQSALQTQLDQGVDPAHLVLAHLVQLADPARQPLQQKALDDLVARGVDPVDAARIVLHVTTRSTGGPATDAAAVLQLLAEGQLIAARRLIDVLAPGMPAASLPPDIAEALTAVAKQEKAFAALRKAGAAAHAAGDIETAAEKFHQAAQIALDDDQLSAVISSLPPGRPTDVVVSASPDGAGIRVFWKAGLGADGQTRYSVVRKVGSAPGDTRDGTVLMPETAETSHVDASPPVAVPLFYGIAATRGGTPSPLATGTTMLVPPVTRVQSASRPTSVTISWQTPRGASGVVVTETGPNGRRDVPVLSQGSATSANLVTGTTYTFDVVAHYAGPDGTTCASAAVRVSAIPRSEADPVKMLDVTAAASPTGQPEAQASWRPIAGYVIEIWYFPAAPRCGYGQRIPYAELESEGGIQLVGRTTATSNRATVTGSVPAGLSHYLAITRDAAEAVVGQTAMLGVCQPVENPKTERFADEVVVSWDWPEQESEVRAIWQGPGLSGERRIRRAEYQEQGGLRIRVGAGTSTIRLVTVVAVQGANWTSPERVVSVAGPSGTLRYQVVWPKRLFGRAKSLTIVFSSDDALDGLTMIIAAKSGRYLPVQSDGCVSLDRVVLALVNGTQTVQVPLPASLGDPYWVRCFAASGHSVMLKEPDHTSLRGH